MARRQPDLLEIFDRYASNICRADLGRYVILNACGGVYADLDCECLKPIEPLLPATGFAIACEPAAHAEQDKAQWRDLPRFPCPSFIASEPGHALWETVFAEIRESNTASDVLDATGPFLLARALARYSGPQTVHVLPTELVYPATKSDCWSGRIHDLEFWERCTRDAFVLHYWDGTWFPHPSASYGLPGDVPVRVVNEQLSAVGWTHRAPPRVSCLMVTRGREPQVRNAINCFLSQSYPHKELVIVTEEAERELRDLLHRLDNPQIRLQLVGQAGLSLGELRNLAVECAQGELVCQWDDDDLYHPERLSTQVSLLMRTGAQACLMQRWMIWWPETERLAVSTRRCWEGSILALKADLPRYPALRRGEDTPVVEHLLQHARVVLFDLPRLYVYTAHGGNTFQTEHFEQHWAAATARYTGERYRAVLRELFRPLPTNASGPPAGIDSPTKPVETHVPGTPGAASRSLPLIVWSAPLFDPSGYAEEARNFVLGLDELNIPVRAHPIPWSRHTAPLTPDERQGFERLLLRPLSKPFVHVQHIFPRHFQPSPDASLRIGRTMFETDRLPEDWVAACNALDEIWVPTEFNIETFARAGVDRRRLFKIHEPFHLAQFEAPLPPLELPVQAGYRFLCILDWHLRKGWDVLLRAYVEEFTARDDVILVLKVSSSAGWTEPQVAGQIQAYIQTMLGKDLREAPVIFHTQQLLSSTDVVRLYQAVDAFVLPSRGEGWGRPYTEAMAAGLPVIGTNWSGNTEFMTAENSYLLDYTLADVPPAAVAECSDFQGHRWAEPSVPHLRQLMRRLFENRAEGKEKGQAAREDVMGRFSRDQVARQVRERIEALMERR